MGSGPSKLGIQESGISTPLHCQKGTNFAFYPFPAKGLIHLPLIFGKDPTSVFKTKSQ